MKIDVALHRLFDQVNDFTSNMIPVKIENEEKCGQMCPHYFGYLAEHINDNPSFPEECLICSKVVDCIVLPLVNINAQPLTRLKKEKEKELTPLAPML